jgi:hypothetical protein
VIATRVFSKRPPGAHAGPVLSEQSRLRLESELGGYDFMLGLAGLHRAGLRWV